MPWTPVPIPTVPSTPRVVGYDLVDRTIAVIPFTVWGDESDLEVTLDGVTLRPIIDFVLASSTGIMPPSPITDGFLRFPLAITGHLVIEGKRSPRRTSNTVEGADTARSRNIDVNTIVTNLVEIARSLRRSLHLGPSELEDGGQFDARNHLIQNVADAIDLHDAANLETVRREIFNGLGDIDVDMEAIEAAVVAAQAARAGAEAAEAGAIAAQLLAQNARDAALASQNAAEGWATQAGLYAAAAAATADHGFLTKAAMLAVTTYPVNDVAEVFEDPTAAFNGFYVWNGSNWISAGAGRIGALEIETAPLAQGNDGEVFWYDHLGRTGAPIRTLYCPRSFKSQRGNTGLVNASGIGAASTRLSTHTELQVGSSNSTLYLVYFDSAGGVYSFVDAAASMPALRGTKELICAIANGQVHNARFRVLTVENEAAYIAKSRPVIERGASGNQDVLYLPHLRANLGGAKVDSAHQTLSDIFYKRVPNVGTTDNITKVYVNLQAMRAGTDPWFILGTAASTASVPNNGLFIPYLTGLSGVFQSDVGAQIMGEGQPGGAIRNQGKIGRNDLSGADFILPSWTIADPTRTDAAQLVDVVDTDALADGWTKAWKAASTGTLAHQIFAGVRFDDTPAGSWVQIRAKAITDVDDAHPDYFASILTADGLSQPMVVQLEERKSARYSIFRAEKLFTGTNKVVGVRFGCDVKMADGITPNTHVVMIGDLQGAAGYIGPSWIPRNDWGQSTDVHLLYPATIHGCNEEPIKVYSEQALMERTDGTLAPASAWEYDNAGVSSTSANVVDLARSGAKIDTSIHKGAGRIVATVPQGNTGLRHVAPLTILSAPKAAIVDKVINCVFITDSLGDATGIGAWFKQELLACGAAEVNLLGTRQSSDWQTVVNFFGECRTGIKASNYTGEDQFEFTPVAPADYAAYLAGGGATNLIQNPFLRQATGGDAPNDCWPHKTTVLAAVDCASVGNLTLSGTQTIDGFAATAGKRVCVKNQTISANNGVYVVAAGTWTRATDMDAWSEVPGAWVTVTNGTVNAGKTFACNSLAGGTLGTTAITWVEAVGGVQWTFDFEFYLTRNLAFFGLAALPPIHFVIDNTGTNDIGNLGGVPGTKASIRSKDRMLRSIRAYEAAYNVANPSAPVDTHVIECTNPLPFGEVGALTLRIKWNTAHAMHMKALLAWSNLKADAKLHIAPFHLHLSPVAGWDYQAVPVTPMPPVALDVTTLTDIVYGGGDVASTTGQIDTRLSASGFLHYRNPNTCEAARILRNIVLNNPPPDP